MPQKCRVCALGLNMIQRLEMDYVDGMSISAISRKYEVEYHSINYHMEKHLSDKLVKGANKKLAGQSMNLMEKMNKMLNEAEKIYKENRSDKKRHVVALKAMAEVRNIVELLAKVSLTLRQNKEVEDNYKVENIPIEELSEPAQKLLFEITQKQMDHKIYNNESIIIDKSGYTDFEEAETHTDFENPENRQQPDLEHLNTPKLKKLKRTKFPSRKENPPIEYPDDDKDLKFKPIVEIEHIPASESENEEDRKHIQEFYSKARRVQGTNPPKASGATGIPIPGFRTPG